MNSLLYSSLPDDVDLDKLMEYDSIEDALQAYKTDPTPENKMRVLNVIAGEVCEMTGLDVDICSNGDSEDIVEGEQCEHCMWPRDDCACPPLDRKCPNCDSNYNECDCEED